MIYASETAKEALADRRRIRLVENDLLARVKPQPHLVYRPAIGDGGNGSSEPGPAKRQ